MLLKAAYLLHDHEAVPWPELDMLNYFLAE
jgi:hypothetical protein